MLNLALLVACKPAEVSSASSAYTDNATDRGADIAAVNCGRCHNIGTDGSSPHPIAPSFGAIVQRYPLDYLRSTLEGGLDAGHLGMPAIELEDRVIEDLKTDMRSLSGP